jgi:hypothetical protein
MENTLLPGLVLEVDISPRPARKAHFVKPQMKISVFGCRRTRK